MSQTDLLAFAALIASLDHDDMAELSKLGICASGATRKHDSDALFAYAKRRHPQPKGDLKDAFQAHFTPERCRAIHRGDKR
jgi:hypothetical protein